MIRLGIWYSISDLRTKAIPSAYSIYVKSSEKKLLLLRKFFCRNVAQMVELRASYQKFADVARFYLRIGKATCLVYTYERPKNAKLCY